MFKKTIISAIFTIIIFTAFSQESYWLAVEKDFQNRDKVPLEVIQSIDNLVKEGENSKDIAQYLKFLYAYMPQSDLADYDFNFFKHQVDIACEARNTFSWGKIIPEDIFRHFVVVYRVNNENLDTARSYIFHQLKNRIKNLSMYDAALEVNHWCHEYVDYQPADARTSSPLATLRTSHGRCGEESTLTVTALRAVGIPARQCYTPRWAHCDDNHAWVEVWVDGKWYFLGACEPAPALNMGWFANVSTRTMMVHTNVFGRYEGNEEINKKTPYYSCVNMLSNYADTVTAYVTVYDKFHRPAKDASVCFKLYNYAEYYTLAEVKTDENGRAKLNTGFGDLLVWAKKGNDYSWSKLDLRKQDHLVLILKDFDEFSDFDTFHTFDMEPPKGRTLINNVSAAAQFACDKRMAKEDKMREAYRKTFPTKAQTDKYKNEYFTAEEFYDVVHRSEGNYAEIIKFLQNNNKKKEGLYLKEFVNALSDKDLRDTKAETLQSQITLFRNSSYPLEVYLKGVLPARISNELIRDWRKPLFEALLYLVTAGRLDWEKPSINDIFVWTKNNITIDPLCNYYNCPISPMGVFNTRRSDVHSRDIFFVAACRSFSIPCYLDNASNVIYVWNNNKWEEISFENKETPSQENISTLTVHNPNEYTYYIHYTLQRFENGEYVSYDFEGDPRVEKQHYDLNLPAGRYCLSTGNRYSDGKVLSYMKFFTLKPNENYELNISIPELTPRNDNYGFINMSNISVNNKTLSQHIAETGKDKMILCIVTPGTEPTNHLAKEMAMKQKDYENWGGKILFVSTNNNWKKEKNQPSNVEIITKNVKNIIESLELTLANAVKEGLLSHTTNERPTCLVVDKFGNIIFVSEGYNIGLGEMMLEKVK